MDDIVLKSNSLDDLAKKELMDFLDFLMFKRQKNSKRMYQNHIKIKFLKCPLGLKKISKTLQKIII